MESWQFLWLTRTKQEVRTEIGGHGSYFCTMKFSSLRKPETFSLFWSENRCQRIVVWELSHRKLNPKRLKLQGEGEPEGNRSLENHKSPGGSENVKQYDWCPYKKSHQGRMTTKEKTRGHSEKALIQKPNRDLQEKSNLLISELWTSNFQNFVRKQISVV